MANHETPLSYELVTKAGVYNVHVVRGSEGISRPFDLTLQFRIASENQSIDPFELPGTVTQLVLRRGERELRRLRGVITDAALTATVFGEPLLSVAFEPELVRCRLRTDARVFRDRTAPEIVKEVLQGAGVAVDMRLDAAYHRRPYCVQYRETDFAFVSRLLEEEGIFYFFQNEVGGSLYDEVAAMVCGDHTGAYGSIPVPATLTFRPMGLQRDDEDSIDALRRASSLAASSVTLRDYNTATPSLDVAGHVNTHSDAGTPYYDFPAKVDTPARAHHKAELLAAAMRCDTQKIGGRATVGRLSPGDRFSIAGAPALVPDGGHVVRSLTHKWDRVEETFAVDFESFVDDVVFRPYPRTPRPVITTPLPGYTVGPRGEDIYVNDMGCVRVHFPWDRRSERDDNASYWVPVAQDDTGQSMAFPRVGWEVMVGFVEGDPDRPVVLGRMYNGRDPFPEPLPAGKTRSSLRSQSSPDRVGYNEIKIDDAAGTELMTIQAQRDKRVEVVNDKLENILGSESSAVSLDEAIKVGRDHTFVLGVDKKTTVDIDQSLTVGVNRTRKVGAAEGIDIVGHRKMTIGASHRRKAGQYDKVTAPLLTERISAANLEASLKPNKTDAEWIGTYTVGGALVELSIKDKEESCALSRAETIGGLVASDAGGEHVIRVEGPRTTNVGAAYYVEGTAGVVLGGTTDVAMKTLTKGTFDGTGTLVLKVAGSTVSFAGGTVAIKSKKVVIHADAKADLKIDSGTHN